MFTSSLKSRFRRSHVVVVQWTSRICTKKELDETIFDLKRFAKYYGLWRKQLESHGWATCYFCSQHRHLAVNIIL